MTTGERLALITPSYEGDLERCRLLCESVDRFAQGDWCHYLLVADHDSDLFQSMSGPRRKIILDSQLLPQWLKPVRQPFDKKKRWRWISTKLTHQVWPMTGWHIQQLRKLLVARHISEQVLVMADSDSFFVRPFSVDTFLQGDSVRLYRVDDAITLDNPDVAKHIIWTRVAYQMLGLRKPALPAPDYVQNLVSWRRDHVLSLLRHIEERAGTDASTAMGRHRTFSEYQLYGAYVSQTLKDLGHWTKASPLCLTYWGGDALTPDTFARFIATLEPTQIAICIQSFTDTAPDLFRQWDSSITQPDAGRSQALI